MKSYLRVLRHPNFRFLFAGQAASIIGDRVVVVAIALFVTQATGSATWETALAHHIPPHALSRVSAYDSMGSLALMPVGYLLAGPLADAFGPRVVLGVGSVIALALLALALLPRSTRTLGGAPFGGLRPAQPSSSRAMSV